MSKTFETVLTSLRDLGDTKLAELDALCQQHKSWLADAVEEAQRRIGAAGPAAKKQKVGDGDSKATAAADDEVSLRPEVVGRDDAVLPPPSRCTLNPRAPCAG